MYFNKKFIAIGLTLFAVLSESIILAHSEPEPGLPGTTPSASPSPAASHGASPSPAVGQVTIHIPQGATGKGPAAYGVNPMVVSVGTEVTWINDDSAPHTVTSDTQVWDSGTLNTGEDFSFKFDQAGTFPYFCTIHGRTSMSGVIQVNDQS